MAKAHIQQARLPHNDAEVGPAAQLEMEQRLEPVVVTQVAPRAFGGVEFPLAPERPFEMTSEFGQEIDAERPHAGAAMKSDAGDQAPPDPARRAHLAVLGVINLIMAVQVVLLLMQRDWLPAAAVTGIIAATLAPAVLRRHLPVEIPSEVQIVVAVFVFATLFLGEVRGYYERFWWWDAVLHTTSGLLLGVLGFMIVYILNEDRHVDLHMRPSFVALFAFFFAVALGAVWEIFEFGMDQQFGTNMQPATANDPSGLTDTIHDLIVDTIGALVVSLAGWRYLVRARKSYVDNWARRFLQRNRRIFGD